MRKILLCIISILSISNSFALDIEILAKCKTTPVYRQVITVFLPGTVGELTHYFLESNQIEYIGDKHGISSLLDTPIGLESIEVLNKDHFRVYGWCFAVDNKVKSEIMSKVIFDPDINQSITWFYGYAESFRGEWINNCVPSYASPESKFCR